MPTAPLNPAHQKQDDDNYQDHPQPAGGSEPRWPARPLITLIKAVLVGVGGVYLTTGSVVVTILAAVVTYYVVKTRTGVTLNPYRFARVAAAGLAKAIGVGVAARLPLPVVLAVGSAVYAGAPEGQTGVAAGLFQTCRFLGAIMSTALLGVAFSDDLSSGGLHRVAVFVTGVALVLTYGAYRMRGTASGRHRA